MRKPFPFKVPVDPDDPDVRIRLMVDMPEPRNLAVHLANQHRIGRDDWPLGTVTHLIAHLYGDFREGAEHYHVKGEYA